MTVSYCTYPCESLRASPSPPPRPHVLEHGVPSARRVLLTSTSCGAIRTCSELLQSVRHRLTRPPALLASAPPALVRTDARPPALLASAPEALVLADARPPALLASAPLALVLADARPPALLASAPLPVMRTAAARLLVRSASRSRGVPAPPPLPGDARGIRRRRMRGALLGPSREASPPAAPFAGKRLPLRHGPTRNGSGLYCSTPQQPGRAVQNRLTLRGRGWRPRAMTAPGACDGR